MNPKRGEGPAAEQTAPDPRRRLRERGRRARFVLIGARWAIFGVLLLGVGGNPSAELYSLVAIYGVSNLVFSLGGDVGRVGRSTLVGLLLFDVAVLGTFLLYLRRLAEPGESFLIVYFLAVLFAALAGRMWAAVATASAAVLVYGSLVLVGGAASPQLSPAEFGVKSLFLLATAVVVSQLARRASQEVQSHREALAAVEARERLAAVFALANRFTSTRRPEELQADLLATSLAALEADSGAVLAYEPRRGVLLVARTEGLPELSEGRRIELGEGIAGWAAQLSEPAVVSEYGRLPTSLKANLNELEMRSLLCAPLQSGDQLLGVLLLGRVRSIFGEEDRSLARALANQAAVALDNARQYQRLRQVNERLSASNQRLEGALSEVREAQDALVQGEKMATVGLLAAGVAHEFNNLIGGMYSLADYARQHRSDDEVVDKALEVVVDGSRRAREITDGLLSFSRQGDRGREEVAVVALLEGVLRLCERELAGSSIHVERQYVEPLPSILVSSGQVQQVILNLVINAQHAIGRGGTITLRARAAPGPAREAGVQLEVADTGGGIAPEHLSKVMEPFFTTKGALGGSRTPGTGLGLSVSQNLVQANGGTLEVRSQVGEGTTARVWLPAASAGAPPSPPRAESPPEVAAVDGCLEPLRILVVEDDASLRSFFAHALVGHELDLAEGGDEALARIGEGRTWDVAFVDLVMPGDVDGAEVLRGLRRMNPRPRLVLTSGRMDDERLLEAAALADSHLKKPFRAPQVLAQLRRGSGGAQAEKV